MATSARAPTSLRRAGALRVVRSPATTPALNMEVDRLLLDAAGPPTLRLYGWSPPGLSLGWFQDAGPFLDVPGRHVIVRRPTGGGAIYHEDEITFALTADALLLPDVEASYALLHDAIANALRAVGVPVHRIEHGPACGARGGVGWCFASPGRHDLVTPDGRKIVGSAQRRVRRPAPRLLHHGSVVLTTPAATPFCASVAEHVTVEEVREALADRMVAALATALRLVPEPFSLAPHELARTAEKIQA